MKRTILTSVVVVTLVIIPGVRGERLFGKIAATQAGQTRAGGVPTFQVEPSWGKIPAKWKLGDVSSIAIDAQNHVWLLHRRLTLPADQLAMAAPPVLEFDEAGNFIQAWGGEGKGYDWPQREHGIHVDYKSNVWIGGNYCAARQLPGFKNVGDDQLVQFTKAGKFVMQIGHASKSSGNADIANLHEPADAVVYQKTNEVFVADGYGNHRVIVFDASTGAFKRMWGAFGNKPVDLYHCPPNTRRGANSTRQEEILQPGPQQFDIIHAVRVSNDGLVYAADRENFRVQVFTLDGKYITQVFRTAVDGRPGGLAFSADPEQAFLYIGGSQIGVYNRKTLQLLDTIKAEMGHHMTSDLKGNIYTAQLGRGVQKLVFKGLSAAASR